MFDSDIFGVQDPDSGKIGYCCIMGALGEVFALAVYLGTEGLEGFLKIQSGQVTPGSEDALTIQNCLMASFEDRGHLTKRDLQVIKELGLKFRGRNAWPLFRRYEPGYAPWHVTKQEAAFLTLALEQARNVALRVKDNRDLLKPPKAKHYMVRVLKREGDQLQWTDQWLKPKPLKKKEVVGGPIDEIRLQRIRKAASKTERIFEIDFFYAPTPVKEEGKPFFPYVFLYVCHQSGMIVHINMTKHSEYQMEFPEDFLDLVEQSNTVPNEIIVSKEEVFKLLEPIASKLNIKMRRVKRLREIEKARSAMFDFFGS